MKRNLLMLVLFSMFLIFSCREKDKEEVIETTVAEDQTAVSDAFDAMEADMEGITETEGLKSAQSLSSFLGKSNPVEGNLKSGNKGTDLFDFLTNTAGLKATNGEINLLDSLNGTYTWNNTIDDWDHSTDPANKLVMVFPSDSNYPEINDAKLTIDGLKMSTYSEDTVPNTIDLDIQDTKGNKYLDVYVEISYNSIPEPTVIDATIAVNPYSFIIDFDNTANKSAYADFSIKESGSILMGLGGTINFFSSTKDSVINISNAQVTYRTMMLKGNVNMAGMEEDIEAGTDMEVALNKNVPMTLNYSQSGSKIADLNFVYDNVGDSIEDVMLVYKDGTSESGINYAEPLVQNIEEDAAALDAFFNEESSSMTK